MSFLVVLSVQPSLPLPSLPLPSLPLPREKREKEKTGIKNLKVGYNKVFGYSNEDLKKKIKILNKNEDIYLMYFIILTIITCFYRESGLNSPRSYLGLDELIETINIKFQSLVKEDIEKISEENEYNFRDVKKVWERLPDAREDINSGKNDKISFVKLVLNFMQEENLIFFDEERRIISITTRFKSIVYFYFEYSKENKNRLLEYVYELGGNENATY